MDFSIQLPENESFSNPSNLNGQPSNIDKFVNYVQVKLDEAIALFDVIGDKNNDKTKELQRTKINEFISSLNLLQTTLNTLYSFLSRSNQPFNFQFLRLIGQVNMTQKLKKIIIVYYFIDFLAVQVR